MVKFLEHPEDDILFFHNFFIRFHSMTVSVQLNVAATVMARINKLNRCLIEKEEPMKKNNRRTYD